MRVKVKLLLFAQARDIAGKAVDELDVPQLSSCSNLLQIIVDQYSLQAIRNNILLAVNEQLCHIEDNLELQNGDEIAVIPPLSGG